MMPWAAQVRDKDGGQARSLQTCHPVVISASNTMFFVEVSLVAAGGLLGGLNCGSEACRRSFDTVCPF